MIEFMPETLDECCAHNPIDVSEHIASSLPEFWSRRVSRRRKVSDQEEKEVVKVQKEVKSKKASKHAVCSLGTCNSEKIPMTVALMHFSQHQMNGDADTCVYAFCGVSDGHMSELNNNRKSTCFQKRAVLQATR